MLILIILIFFFFIIFCIYKNIEKFKINTQSYKNFNNNKPTIIIGSSEYINEHIEDLKRLKKTGKYQFIAHQTSFNFFQTKLGFYPDYLSVFDPQVPLYIKNYDNIFKEKKLVKLIYYSFWDEEDYDNISGRVLGTPVLKKGREYWKNYNNTKLKISNRIIIPTKFIRTNKTKTKNNFKNSKKKDKNKKKLVISHFPHHNKFTLHILPLILFLNIKNVYIMGFDCIGTNWNSKSKRIGGLIRFCKSQYKLKLPKFIKELKRNNINLFNLVKPKNTELYPYINYKNIKELK